MAARNRAKTACKFGHSFVASNTYVHRGKRYCELCNRIHVRRITFKKKVQSMTNSEVVEALKTKAPELVKQIRDEESDVDFAAVVGGDHMRRVMWRQRLELARAVEILVERLAA